MPESHSGPGAHGGIAPSAIAVRLETLTDRLSDTLKGAAGAAPEGAEGCLDELKQISSMVRSLGLVFDPARVEAAARREEELKSIVIAIGESIHALAGANRQIAEKVGGQIKELDAIINEPPGLDMASRLRDAVISVREAAVEMDDRMEEMSTELGEARERVTSLETQVNRARQKALYDSLTRIYSRGALDERLEAMVKTSGPWCLLLLDIDRFKAVNDRYGHVVGDALLFKVCRIIEDLLRVKAPDSLFGRYGGEEFVVILPERTLDQASQVAEAVRGTMAGSRWQCRGVSSEPVLTATISIGVAQRRSDDTATSLISRADEALYRAKKAGRNRVCAEDA